MNDKKITSDDAIFFMDMAGSFHSPNATPTMHSVKPYYKILDNPNSNEFQRFIKVYNASKHLLSDREQSILDALYGITHPRRTLKEASIPHNISPERVRQIRQDGERKITRVLLKYLD